MNISGKNDLGAFTRPGDDCLYFMRGQVLGFGHGLGDLLAAPAQSARRDGRGRPRGGQTGPEGCSAPASSFLAPLPMGRA